MSEIEVFNIPGWYLDRDETTSVVLLTDHIAALEAVKATVKPLEWQDGRDDRSVFSIVQMATILDAEELFGLEYTSLGPDRHGLFEVILGDKIIEHADSEANAKAAAQADYEQRILSAIVPSPALEAKKIGNDPEAYVTVGMVQAKIRAEWLASIALEANQQVIAAARQMVSDYQTSAQHHPDHVLVPLSAFTAMQSALRALTPTQPEPTRGQSDDA